MSSWYKNGPEFRVRGWFSVSSFYRLSCRANPSGIIALRLPVRSIVAALALQLIFFSDIINATQSYRPGEHMQFDFSMLHRKILKQLIVLALLFISFLPTVHSFASGLSYIPCDCLNEPCSCFIQEGDEGNFVKEIIKLLTKKKYLPKKFTPKTIFNADVTKAVKQFQKDNNLMPTGTMDDDTLTLLIWDMLPEKLDRVMPLVSGKPSTYPDTVYIPTDGGKKRHATRECCNMEDPRKVSIRNAEEIGFDACKIKYCERYVELTLH